MDNAQILRFLLLPKNNLRDGVSSKIFRRYAEFCVKISANTSCHGNLLEKGAADCGTAKYLLSIHAFRVINCAMFLKEEMKGVFFFKWN